MSPKYHYQVKDTRNEAEGSFVEFFDTTDDELPFFFTKQFNETVSIERVHLIEQETVKQSTRPSLEMCEFTEGMEKRLLEITKGYSLSAQKQSSCKTQITRMDGELASKVMIFTKREIDQKTKEEIREATTSEKRFPLELIALGVYSGGKFVLPHPEDVQIPNRKTEPIKALTQDEARHSLTRESTSSVSLLFGFQRLKEEETVQMYCDCFRGLFSEEFLYDKPVNDPQTFEALCIHVSNSSLRKLEGLLEKHVLGAPLRETLCNLTIGKRTGLSKLGIRRMINETLSSIYDVYTGRVSFSVNCSVANVQQNGALATLEVPYTRDVAAMMSQNLTERFKEFFETMDFETAFKWCASMLFQLERCAGFLDYTSKFIQNKEFSSTTLTVKNLIKKSAHINHRLIVQEEFFSLMLDAEKLCFSHFVVAFKEVVENFALFTKDQEKVRKQNLEKPRYNVNEKQNTVKMVEKTPKFVIT